VETNDDRDPAGREIRRRLTLEEFRAAGLELVGRVTATESVPLTEAVGRVAAHAVRARLPLPAFRRSAVDGYALIASERHRPLTVVGKVTAGRVPDRPVRSGEAIMVTTGAMVPEGADAVALVERSEVSGDVVRILEPVEAGSHVSPIGEDFRADQELIPRDRLLEPVDVAALASQGLEAVTVWRKPRVGIISTGDELIPVGGDLPPGHVYDVNGTVLAATVRALGAEPVLLGRLEDRYPVVRSALEAVAARTDWDLLVTSGGTGASIPVFAGQNIEELHDLMPAVLAEVGELHAHGIRMTPGRPTALGRLGGRPAFLLPGWPYAVLVHFELLVAPAIARMAGRPETLRRPVAARVTDRLEASAELTRIIQVALSEGPGGLEASLLLQPPPPSASRIMTQMLAADGYVVVDRHQTLEPGQEVTVWASAGDRRAAAKA
jgi:molybdopterin molybdotransferase